MTPLLYNAPTDLPMWLTFGAVHQSDHFQIVQGIFFKRSIIVPMLPIDPVPLESPEMMLVWFMNHQALHAAMNQAMGVSGTDLSYVDFRDQARMTVWMQYNAYEHQQIAAVIAGAQPPALPPSLLASQAVLPQPLGTQPQPQPGGVNGLQPQPSPVAVQPQPPSPTVQTQPNPAVNPQPGTAPATGLQPGTPIVPGNPNVT